MRNDTASMQPSEREPKWARTRWFCANYGITRYLLMKLAEKGEVDVVKLNEGRTGILLYRVQDVKNAIKSRLEKRKAARKAHGADSEPAL